MVVNFTQTQLPTFIRNLTAAQIGSDIKLGTGCNLGRFNNNIFNLSSNGITILTTPSWIIQAQSDSLVYIVANQSLYKYSSVSLSYSPIFSLDIYQQYSLLNKDNQIVIIGSNSSINVNSSTYEVIQKIYILKDNEGVINNLATYNFVSSANLNSTVPVFVSPLMSKLQFEYTASTNNSKVIVFKNIDWSNNLISDMAFQNIVKYIETTRNIQTFTRANHHLGDYYLVVRNESGLTAEPTALAVEQAYQFVGDSIMLLRKRDISAAEITIGCYRIKIDSSLTNSLYVLDFYRNGNASYDVN